MDWYTKVLKQYADFNGRARRKEYWSFILISILVWFGLATIDGFIGLKTGDTPIYLLSSLYVLGVLIPSVAAAVRRTHDTNRSGLWTLVLGIPCVGWIFWFVIAFQDSTPGTNQYGPNPKGV